MILGTPVAVMVKAKDAAGNDATPCTIMITVTDQTAPTIKVPTNMVVNADAGSCSAVVNFTVTATDNCSASTVTCSPPSGSTFAKGNNTVICTASDSVGNVGTKSFTVTVKDSQAPTIIGVTPSLDQLWPPTGKLIPVTVTVSATDNCDTPSCEIINVSSSEPITGGVDTTSPDYEITGPLSVNLRAERLDLGPGRVYTITVRCIDASGNSSTKNAQVTVPHDQKARSAGEL